MDLGADGPERGQVDLGVVRADGRSAPFFAAAGRDELLIRRCGGCSRWLGPEATGCPGCGAAELDWAAACGRGVLVSFAVLPGAGPDSGLGSGLGSGAGDAAAVLALVELDEGPWLHSRLAVGPQAAVVGMRVRTRFEHPAVGESYPLFWPETDG